MMLVSRRRLPPPLWVMPWVVRFWGIRLCRSRFRQSFFPGCLAWHSDHRRFGHILGSVHHSSARGNVLWCIGCDKYGRQKILAITIILMTFQHLQYRTYSFYYTIGFWAPVLLLIAKMVQGFSVGGIYRRFHLCCGVSPDRKRGFLGSWLDFGSLVGFVCGAGVVVLLTTILGQETFNDWGWRIPFFMALPLGLVGLYLRHALEETPTFQKHVDSLEEGSKQGLSEGPSSFLLKRLHASTGGI
ncbi:MFS transporter (plasmid) [Pseudomonas silvicola]|nr:MFS transporter [Pseudomonas silvicola]